MRQVELQPKGGGTPKIPRSLWFRAWLKALRLQFYPMTFLAYALGAKAASPGDGLLSNPLFWLGYLCLFCVEVATVLINEIVDFPSDRQNRFSSTFTGGSRVLVEGLLTRRELCLGAMVALSVFAVAAFWLLAMRPILPMPLVLGAGLIVLLALGYTAPPLKLSYRGLGELDVALTQGLGPILVGYLVLEGSWRDSLPWLLGLPLMLAILPSIILAGIPDVEADENAGKRTLAVRLGRRGALRLALAMTLLSVFSAMLWQQLELAAGALSTIIWFVIPHGGYLAWRLGLRLQSGGEINRIDELMVLSLSFLLWFIIVPLYEFSTPG